jgi:hypothetical protein
MNTTPARLMPARMNPRWKPPTCMGSSTPQRSVGFAHFFKNGPNKSIGIGRKVVVLCSLAISRIVCR